MSTQVQNNIVESLRRSAASSELVSARDWFLSDFHAFEKNLNGAAASFQKVRRAAIDRFAALGFPTTRNEEWKYTDITALTKHHFQLATGQKAAGVGRSDIDKFTYNIKKAHVAVFVNGYFSAELSSLNDLPPGVKVQSLAAVMRNERDLVEKHLTKYAGYENEAFTALNTAFLQDGVFIHIPKKVIVETPIHMLFISTGGRETYSRPRTLVVADESSQVALIESHAGLGDNTYLTNAVSEIVVGENAVVEHDKVQNDSPTAFHISTTQVYQHRNSNFVSNAIAFGGTIVRNNVNVVLDGEGAEATLNGLYLGTENQLIDNHTMIDHAKPHCPSHELYKGILAGTSKGVFNGKIAVRKDAQKTDAKQTNKNLILSEGASVDTKPQLEIFANDVRCTHGATIGQLDEEAVFYLRSRGVGLDKARDILIYAFASDVIDRIKVEEMRDELQAMLHDRLERSRAFQKRQ